MASERQTWEFPSYTNTIHRSTYPAIDPSNPANSAAGKVIVVTGGGSGVGRGIATAFVAAGAKAVAILGRRMDALLATKSELEKAGKTQILAVQADVVDDRAMATAFATVAKECGPVNVVVANAGYQPKPTPLASSDFADWWRGYEVNVKGTALLFRAWLPHKATTDAAFVCVNSALAHYPQPTFSAYTPSKLAQYSLVEVIRQEHPDIHAVNLHPGVIATDMNKSSGSTYSHDDLSLPSSFAVWLTSPAAKFLNGRFAWAHWDVDELAASKEGIESAQELSIVLNGWPKVMQPKVVA